MADLSQLEASLTGSLAGTRVVIAEDDTVHRLALANYLKSQDCEVLPVANARQLRGVLNGGASPSVLLVSLWLGRSNTLEIIRRNHPDPGGHSWPVLLIASNRQAADLQPEEEAEIVQRLRRPVHFTKLKRLLLELVRGWQLRRDAEGQETVLDLLRVFHLDKRTARYSVSGDPPGTVTVVRGEVVDAFCDALVGEAALAKLVARSVEAVRSLVMPEAVESTISGVPFETLAGRLGSEQTPLESSKNSTNLADSDVDGVRVATHEAPLPNSDRNHRFATLRSPSQSVDSFPAMSEPSPSSTPSATDSPEKVAVVEAAPDEDAALQQKTMARTDGAIEQKAAPNQDAAPQETALKDVAEQPEDESLAGLVAQVLPIGKDDQGEDDQGEDDQGRRTADVAAPKSDPATPTFVAVDLPQDTVRAAGTEPSPVAEVTAPSVSSPSVSSPSAPSLAAPSPPLVALSFASSPESNDAPSSPAVDSPAGDPPAGSDESAEKVATSSAGEEKQRPVSPAGGDDPAAELLAESQQPVISPRVLAVDAATIAKEDNIVLSYLGSLLPSLYAGRIEARPSTIRWLQPEEQPRVKLKALGSRVATLADMSEEWFIDHWLGVVRVDSYGVERGISIFGRAPWIFATEFSGQWYRARFYSTALRLATLSAAKLDPAARHRRYSRRQIARVGLPSAHTSTLNEICQKMVGERHAISACMLLQHYPPSSSPVRAQFSVGSMHTFSELRWHACERLLVALADAQETEVVVCGMGKNSEALIGVVVTSQWLLLCLGMPSRTLGEVRTEVRASLPWLREAIHQNYPSGE